MIGRMQSPGLDGAKDQVRRAHPMARARYDRQSHADPQAEGTEDIIIYRPGCTRAADSNGQQSRLWETAREKMS